jgi:hypothetical protein
MIGSIFISLILITTTGCGVSQSEYDALLADYEAVNKELAQIKEVYPLQYFPSISTLEAWLASNDISERPAATFADAWYRKALDIQEDAIKDGYLISADYDYFEDTDEYMVYCVAIIDGEVWWWDPETDDVLWDSALGKVENGNLKEVRNEIR